MTSKQKLLQLAVEGIGGRHWYKTARTCIGEFCHTHDVDTDKFICGLAVLSPQISVSQNMHLAVGWFMCQVPPNLMRSVNISFENLIKGDYRRECIKGPKTGRFADALMGDPGAVVLDTHMGYALGVPATRLRNKSIQQESEKRIKWVANQLSWTPAETQAAIWTGQRAQAGHRPSGIERWQLDRALNNNKDNNPF
tara:strand:- start:8308 stop:8895 length:588 start_codon:yes stop_codon:yes gene_type:complete